ncbi:hypothetical protein [Polyangium jinanense]|uniref:Uncharacterized protein n=1 Tax=Polyangium jinanense TaxID=2829994 RepID=A0A9X3XF33_9BACT|nr:hypothetical protein [Polyangium jinanense]MDC3959032.1 hypothetical protein [Polyangium jinanense]MDC3989204.1 hypothetical protein [Polyangium jinanense]
MKRHVWFLLAIAPLALVPAAFTAVLATGSPVLRAAIPIEAHARDHCTWHCHNHGCSHAPSLPLALAGDGGLYGKTIAGLKAAGKAVVPSAPHVGYGVVNLALFCVAWPGLMYALYLVALSQRRKLLALRRGAS